VRRLREREEKNEGQGMANQSERKVPWEYSVAWVSPKTNENLLAKSRAGFERL
jgi:hypothetical protein